MTSRSLIDGASLVRRIVARLGCSERTLRRRCHESFGYGPRTLARILRFQRFVELVDCATKERLSVLAAQAGYADQAHLTREVRSFSGHTPRSLVHELGS
jgi:AraC-like DNA-binding protein